MRRRAYPRRASTTARIIDECAAGSEGTIDDNGFFSEDVVNHLDTALFQFFIPFRMDRAFIKACDLFEFGAAARDCQRLDA